MSDIDILLEFVGNSVIGRTNIYSATYVNQFLVVSGARINEELPRYLDEMAMLLQRHHSLVLWLLWMLW